MCVPFIQHSGVACTRNAVQFVPERHINTPSCSLCCAASRDSLGGLGGEVWSVEEVMGPLDSHGGVRARLAGAAWPCPGFQHLQRCWQILGCGAAGDLS